MENAARRIWRKSLWHNDLQHIPIANAVPIAKNLAPANTVPNYSANNYFRLAWNYIWKNGKIMLDD